MPKGERRYAVTFRRRPLSATTPDGLVERRVVVVAHAKRTAAVRAWERLERDCPTARAAYYVQRINISRDPAS